MYLRCRTGNTVTDAEFAFLAGLPGGQYQLPHRVTCDLQEGHGQDHIAFVQCLDQAEQSAWWLTWTRDSRSLIELPYCCDDCTPADACLLPEGHDGRHSPQLTTVLAPPPDLHLFAAAPTRAR